MAHWWACVIAVSAYWILGDDVQAQQLYDTVQNVPKQITHDPLVKAVHAAFNGRKIVTSVDNNYDAKSVLKLCDFIGNLLQESISVTECLQSDYKDVVIYLKFMCLAKYYARDRIKKNLMFSQKSYKNLKNYVIFIEFR